MCSNPCYQLSIHPMALEINKHNCKLVRILKRCNEMYLSYYNVTVKWCYCTNTAYMLRVYMHTRNNRFVCSKCIYLLFCYELWAKR
jgi:hypothetical protein